MSREIRPDANDNAETPSRRTRIRRHPERAVSGTADIVDILSQGFVAHVGFAQEGQPYVIPMTYHFDATDPTRIYLHGSHQSRLLKHLTTGAPVCIEVILLDGLVYSRTAQHHSVNYRSVTVFGRGAATLDTSAQRRVMEAMIARYHPGRTAGREYEPIPDAHLTTTSFIAVEIEDWSAKVRTGGPKGPRDNEPDAMGTAGVVPLAVR